MPGDTDWVFKMKYHAYAGTAVTENPMYSKSLGDLAGEKRLIALGRDNDNVWLRMGTNGGGFVAVTAPMAIGTDRLFDLTYHYKAAGPAIDIYLDNVLIVADYATGAGQDGYQLDYLQFETSDRTNGDVDAWSDIIIGQYIPEPATMLILGLGSVLALRRKK